METPIRVLDGIDKLDMLPPLESCQTDVVDSMTPPHAAEYASAQYALARDCATLQLVEQDIEACRIRIARAHAEMRLLERQRDAVQRRVSVHRARLSPLRAVPDQILQEIFQHCLPDTPYVVPNAHSAPLVLTHVCRRWRTVVQASSELWSSIALRDLGVWNYELEVEMVKRWLERSSTRPIRMSITCPPRTDFGLDGNVSRSDIFQLAIAHSAQLSDVHLNVNRTYLHYFLACARLPALRSIVLSLHAVHRNDEPLELNVPASISAPNLRCIAFKGDGTSISLIPRSVFSHITHLSLDCHMTLDLALLVQDFAHLQYLALTLSLSRDTGLRLQLPHHRLVVPSLRSLDLHLDKDMLEFGDPDTLETLLEHLELPALDTLVIAAPLRPRCDPRTGRVEARPSVASVLARARRYGARARLVCWDLGSSGGGVGVGADDGTGEDWA
ncbi:hypothetical protein EV363DRAFT_1321110 [Boletus edulis]|nr:hypothetical protein EV363DRAFT_1321110 [Boletus edulis]